jgi:hypothetical protein
LGREKNTSILEALVRSYLNKIKHLLNKFMRISDNVASNWQPHYLGVAALDELDALFRSLAERGALLMIGSSVR